TVGGVPVPQLDISHPLRGPSASGHTLILGTDSGQYSYLLQYAAGRTSLILAPGAAMPGGHWSASVRVAQPVRLNADGVVLFAAQWVPTGASKAAWGIFRWDTQSQQITPVAVTGTQTTNGQTIVLARSDISPVLNNAGEAVFSAVVKDAAGQQSGG